jgi:hypothetical protein
MSVTNYSDASVWAPDGTFFHPYVTTGPKDTNGNYVSTSVDTLGRTPVTKTTNGNQIYYDIPDSRGSTRRYTVTTQTINVSTNFGQSGVSEWSGTVTVFQSIQLPDGTGYSFNYDSGTTAGHYGLLTSMTLPTGGQISYTWSVFSDAGGNKYAWISSRTTPDSTTPWTYTPNVVTTCGSGQVNCQQTFTIQKPNGDNTVYTSTLNGGGWAGSVQSYIGAVSSANLLSRVTQCWNFVTLTNGTCS